MGNESVSSHYSRKSLRGRYAYFYFLNGGKGAQRRKVSLLTPRDSNCVSGPALCVDACMCVNRVMACMHMEA